MRKRCDKIRDRSLIEFYDNNHEIGIITNKRGIQCYEASRKVLPIRFEQFFKDFIQPFYDQITYGQFRALVPFYIFECAVGWSTSCVCRHCCNFRFGIELIHQLANRHNVQSMKELNYEVALEKHVCHSDDYFQALNCMRLRNHNYCYAHIKRESNCLQCMHSCQSRLMDYILDAFKEFQLTTENVRFARLAEFGKDRWLPIKPGL